MNYKKKVLDNGLRVIVVPMKGAPSVTVLALVETGSKYESKKESGLAHFLEHMFFKGTNRRPTAMDIAKEFDSMGAQNNAFTGQEYTGYWAKAHSKNLDNILDIISDIYLNATFPSAEIEKEKGVIVEEINMYEDLPHRNVFDVYADLLYGDTPAGRPIVGSRENVRSFTREDFINYKKAHYISHATTVVVSGDVGNEDEIFEKVDKYFKGIEEGEKKDKEKGELPQTAPRLKLKYKDTDQTHLVIGVKTFDLYDKRSVTLKVLNTIVGGGMSSRLFQKMREELGICYYVRAGLDEQTDRGSFAVSAGVDSKRLPEAVQAILDELVAIRDTEVDSLELRKAKDYMIGNMYLGLESSDALADFYGFQEVLREEIKTPSEIEKEIEAVTAHDIQKVAREVLKTEFLNMAIIGKYTEKDMEPVKQILSL